VVNAETESLSLSSLSTSSKSMVVLGSESSLQLLVPVVQSSEESESPESVLKYVVVAVVLYSSLFVRRRLDTLWMEQMLNTKRAHSKTQIMTACSGWRM